MALSFHLDAHPNAVERLTRCLTEHGIGFALYEAFTIDKNGGIAIESDLGSPEGD